MSLGIDAEYTRPGVEALLEQFEKLTGESGDEGYHYPIDWRPKKVSE